MSKDLVCKKEKKYCNKFDYTKENAKEHNTYWPQIPDHRSRILIIGGSGSGITNTLFNQIG